MASTQRSAKWHYLCVVHNYTRASIGESSQCQKYFLLGFERRVNFES
jgi:hypothetical protein